MFNSPSTNSNSNNSPNSNSQVPPNSQQSIPISPSHVSPINDPPIQPTPIVSPAVSDAEVAPLITRSVSQGTQQQQQQLLQLHQYEADVETSDDEDYNDGNVAANDGDDSGYDDYDDGDGEDIAQMQPIAQMQQMFAPYKPNVVSHKVRRRSIGFQAPKEPPNNVNEVGVLPPSIYPDLSDLKALNTNAPKVQTTETITVDNYVVMSVTHQIT